MCGLHIVSWGAMVGRVRGIFYVVPTNKVSGFHCDAEETVLITEGVILSSELSGADN